MAGYTLYCFRESGNAYKVALMLALTGNSWGAIWVDFFNKETRSDDYRENLNEMGEVPVLVDGDKRLAQSGVILDYLAEQTGQFGFENDDERREILRWLLWDNHKLTAYTATYRFLRTFVKGAEPAVLDFLEGRMKAAFAILEKHLTDREFVVENRLTIADISICGYLFFEDEFGVDWADYPAIGAWLGRIKAMPGWQHPYDLLPGGPMD
ncbi:glutathione S-transferase family protein [Rhodobacteraceae bacterium NNCM2]|nr:glutathione S-transferase family protein [Coraliihabitans acroporae]